MTVLFRSRSFSVPKGGNREDENEDKLIADDALGRYAIADGATEGAYSGAWAAQLVKRYVEHPFTPLDDSSESLQEWLPPFSQPPRDVEHVHDSVPWYLERALERGSFATLLGVAFRETAEPQAGMAWDAMSVGDSCLFQVKQGLFLASFPLSSAHDFHDAPLLISTVAAANAGLVESLSRTTGELGVSLPGMW